jgi:hypothetical protein
MRQAKFLSNEPEDVYILTDDKDNFDKTLVDMPNNITFKE